jgi:hypothetical protein
LQRKRYNSFAITKTSGTTDRSIPNEKRTAVNINHVINPIIIDITG